MFITMNYSKITKNIPLTPPPPPEKHKYPSDPQPPVIFFTVVILIYPHLLVQWGLVIIGWVPNSNQAINFF